eukprot:scaffold473527_cov14-Prasinocladus_malaysianus.AAC.1
MEGHQHGANMEQDGGLEAVDKSDAGEATNFDSRRRLVEPGDPAAEEGVQDVRVKAEGEGDVEGVVAAEQQEEEI